MRIVFIGNCGHSMQAFREMKECPQAEFVGAAPGSEHESMQSMEGFGAPVYARWQEMMEKTRPDVAVVSPVFGLTGSVILECAARGIHVFAEKPVACSLGELDAVRRAVEKSGVHFSAMHFLRFLPAFYHGQKMAAAGAVGEIRMITAQKSYKWGRRPEWYGDRALYTGTIPWVGIHAVDWIDSFARRPFRSVAALHAGRPEKTALCQFELEGGLLAGAHIDYLRPEAAPTHGDDRVRVAGSRGVMEVLADKIVLLGEEGERTYRPRSAPRLALDFLMNREEITKEDVFRVTEAALRARDAADAGERMGF